MDKLRLGKTGILTAVFFAAALCTIIILIVLPEDFWSPKKKEWTPGKTITAQNITNEDEFPYEEKYERMSYAESVKSVIRLEDGEIQISALSEDFDGDGAEEQVVAYRNLTEPDNPVYITYIDYDSARREYFRTWSAPTPATRPGTISLVSIDLIGDHRNCIVVTGLGRNDEQTLTAFKINDGTEDGGDSYKIIAKYIVDGTISIQEVERSQAYQMGFARGAGFNITERGRDPYSANELDQIETTYSYNPVLGLYERIGTARIPGAQIEANLMRELLKGGKQDFERFIDGLWYHINSEGTIDNDRYIYFDTTNGEVSFYSDDTQQVYKWQSSYSTGFGIFISSQNISVSSLNRKINIELESPDSIRVRVSEDVRMRIIMNAPWDGSYRKAKSLHNTGRGAITVRPAVNAEYNSPIGKITFTDSGAYTVMLNGAQTSGKYSFYQIGKNELLDFVPLGGKSGTRQTYRVERGSGNSASMELYRVRLGISGLYEFHEPSISLR